MSNLHDKALNRRVMEEMDKNCIIEDIGIDITPITYVTGVRTTVFEGIGRNNDRVEFNSRMTLSEEKCKKIQNGEIEEQVFLDNHLPKYGELPSFLYNIIEYEDVSFQIVPEIELFVKLKPYNGKSKWYSKKKELDNEYHYEPIVDSYVNSRDIYIEETSDTISVPDSGFEEPLNLNRNVSTSQENSDILIEFLSKNARWIDATFGSFKEKDDFLEVPIVLNTGTLQLIFENVDELDSKLWELAEKFNFDRDPWNLQNENVQLALINTTKDCGFARGYFCLRNPQETSGINKITKTIQSIL